MRRRVGKGGVKAEEKAANGFIVAGTEGFDAEGGGKEVLERGGKKGGGRECLGIHEEEGSIVCDNFFKKRFAKRKSRGEEGRIQFALEGTAPSDNALKSFFII